MPPATGGPFPVPTVRGYAWHAPPTYPILAEDAPALNFQDPSVAAPGGPNPFPGGDVLLTDVISFDVVSLLVQGASQFQDLFQLTANGFTPNNPAFNAATWPSRLRHLVSSKIVGWNL